MSFFRPTSQLLLRNLHTFTGTHLLVVNYPPDDLLPVLQTRFVGSKVCGFTYDYTAYRYVLAQFTGTSGTKPDMVYGVEHLTTVQYDTVVIYLPQSRQLTELILQMVVGLLTPSACVFLVGENNAGIRSIQRLLAETVGPTFKVDAARHCVLFRATLHQQAKPFDLAAWRVAYSINVGGKSLAVTSFPGVFSHGQLDAGTNFLLQTLNQPHGKRVLDFGCGSGVIGAMINLQWPGTKVDLVDSNAFALTATHQTFTDNGLPVDHIYPSDIFSDVQDTYDWILSNPPFHKGVKTNYQIATTFIKEAASRLRPGGTFQVVVNRFLKYQSLIEEYIGTCRILADNRQYCVYQAIRTVAGHRTDFVLGDQAE